MKSRKINTQNIIKQYESGVSNYSKSTYDIGLWESEKTVLLNYFKKSDRILDIGCGTGRTSFGLYQLGYINLSCFDITPGMIEAAKCIAETKGVDINFSVDDVTQMSFENESFDAAFFSFNGLMSIPQSTNRATALNQINRILKPNSYFIFTTHDRHAELDFLAYWQEEKRRWAAGKQDQRLYEFGDRLAMSKNENTEIYIHIPSVDEVTLAIQKAGFTLVETFYRSEQFDESDQVKAFSGECRFWVLRKA